MKKYLKLSLEELHQAQKEEGTCQTLIKAGFKENSKFYIEQVDGDPFLYGQCDDPDRRGIYIPAALRWRVMRLAHYPTISGHPGAKMMFKVLRKEVYWPTMMADVYEYVKLVEPGCVTYCHLCCQSE
jgi:Integrase zinc binding domain